MAKQGLDEQLREIQELIQRLQEAADDPNISQQDRERIADEIKAVRDQVRRFTQ